MLLENYMPHIYATSYASVVFLFTSAYLTSILCASRAPQHRERGHANNITYAYNTCLIYVYYMHRNMYSIE